MQRSFFIIITCVVLTLLGQNALAKEYVVKTQKQYKNVMGKLVAGDEVVLANGIWSDFEIVFKAQGSKKKPVTLRAETAGQVILSGQSNFRLAGQYLVVSGLVFKNGYTLY